MVPRYLNIGVKYETHKKKTKKNKNKILISILFNIISDSKDVRLYGYVLIAVVLVLVFPLEQIDAALALSVNSSIISNLVGKCKFDIDSRNNMDTFLDLARKEQLNVKFRVLSVNYSKSAINSYFETPDTLTWVDQKLADGMVAGASKATQLDLWWR